MKPNCGELNRPYANSARRKNEKMMCFGYSYRSASIGLRSEARRAG